MLSRATVHFVDDATDGNDLSPESQRADDDEWTGYVPWEPDRPHTFRTVCVRLCDGAFFPMSFSTTRDRFKGDAARCQKSCGSPARLFVAPQPSEGADDLVDVHGAAYADLPNAFKFQTSYDKGCSCHAQPWEEASRERHRQLAELAAAGPARQMKSSTPQPAVTSTRPVGVDVSAPVLASAGDAGSALSTSRPAAVTTQHVAAVPQAQRLPVVLPPVTSHRPAATEPTAKAAFTGQVVLTAPVVSPVKPSPARPSAKPASGTAKRGLKPAPARTVIASADVASRAQRSFRSADYWRLSYWEPRN